MNVLEKILEEIGTTERIRFSKYTELLIAVKDAEKIIRSHMNEVENDGWIPVEERLPEESLNSVIGWDKHRERCVFVQFWNGRWIFGNDIEPVLITAWQPLPKLYKTKKLGGVG